MSINSKLHIQTARRGNITYLKEAYFTQPFKLADIREDKKEDTLQLMLMRSSPGILDGDNYHIQIDLGENCSLDLHTQSYQRLFTMTTGASQNMEVNLKQSSFFQYLPHPCVPHQSSDFTARNRINLSNNCRLVWGEILTCGRKLNNEVFLLTRYHNITEIFLNGKLIIKENLLIKPSETNPLIIGQLESFTHQASLILLNDNFDIKQLSEKIINLLEGFTEITFGLSEAPVNGLIIRILGNKAEQLHSILKSVAQLVSTYQTAIA
jgi:urease accessory protein